MEQKPPILNLDSRLAAVANSINPCRTVADIGSDHAYLPIFLLLQNTAERAIVTDIHSGPLQNSRENAAHYGVSDRCDFRLGDGLDPLIANEADAICVCGMGGDTIADILSENESIARNCSQLILQPMTRQPYLRKFLVANDFPIVTETLVRDKHLFYQIITAEPKNSESINESLNKGYRTEEDFCFPPSLIASRDRTMQEYLNYRLQIEKKILRELNKQTDIEKGNACEQRIFKITERLQQYESI